MEAFARLTEALSWPANASRKAGLTAAYLSQAAPADRMHAIALLSNRCPRRLLYARDLCLLAFRASGLPHWLFGETEKAGGRSLEPLARLEPLAAESSGKALGAWLEGMVHARNAGAEAGRDFIRSAWPEMTAGEKILFNQLATGSFRSPLRPAELLLALEGVTGLDRHALARRLLDNWDPHTTDFDAFFSGNGAAMKPGPPYSLQPWRVVTVNTVEVPSAGWYAVPVPEGIRAQWAVHRGRATLLTEGGMPAVDLLPFGDALPEGTVLDGIITAGDLKRLRNWLDHLGRRPATRISGLGFTAVDILEADGADLRERPFSERLERLLGLPLPKGKLPVSLPGNRLLNSQAELDDMLAGLRTSPGDGLLLRKPGGAYGPAPGDWLFLRPDPYEISCVLLYVAGSGRAFDRQGEELTLAVRYGDGFVPVARVSGGLSASELAEIRQFVAENTVERFGPVRVVEARQVFTLAFDGLTASRRRKAGLELKRPRITAWNKDATVEEIDDLDTLSRLL